MSDVVKNLSIMGVEEEVTEGTYVSPSAVTSYFQPVEDGFEIAINKEAKEREVLTSSVFSEVPRRGMTEVEATFPVELRASGLEGGAPDFSPLIKSIMGSVRTLGARVTTKNSGNTDQILQIQDADIGSFRVGDIIVVLQSGDTFVSPIITRVTTPGSASITLLRTRAAGVFSNSVQIAKFTNYIASSSGHPSLSFSWYMTGTDFSDSVRRRGYGCKGQSMSLESFTTGELAKLNFKFMGLNGDETLTTPPHSVSAITYDTGLPPVILSSCIYKNGEELPMNEFSFTYENTIAAKTSTCSPNGKISQRIPNSAISGKINPYKPDDLIDFFTEFSNDTSFSLFAYAAIPSTVAGELALGSIIGFYFPVCHINTHAIGDLNGLSLDDIEFSTHVNGVNPVMTLGMC